MPHICKITVYLFYLSTLQFTAAFGILTGENLEQVKAAQKTRSIISDQDAVSTSPTLTEVPRAIFPANAKRIMAVTQVFALQEEDEKPCEVSGSLKNKGTFNCTPSSSSSEPVVPRVKQCGSHSQRVGQSCLCDEGYRKFPFSEVCVKDEGQPCQFQQNNCYSDLTNMACINNVCSCENSDIFDPITSRCVGRVGGLCFPQIKDCTLNAECVNVPASPAAARAAGKRVTRRDITSGYYFYQQADQMPSMTNYQLGSGSDIELSGQCQCKSDFVESKDGLCKKTYGQTCDSGYECDNLHLVCKEGECTCPDSLQVYDLATKSCVGLVGARCSNEPGGTLCVEHAFCQKLNLKVDGKCACLDDAEDTIMRTCERVELPIPSILMRENRDAVSNRVLFSA